MNKHTFSSQTVRDALMAVFLFFSIAIYWQGLGYYLSALSNPLLMKYGLSMSLIIAGGYEIKGQNFRQAMIATLVITVLFASVPWLAHIYREWYLLAIAQLGEIDAEAAATIGIEYIRALDNPAIGIGACYGMALASVRLPFKGLLTKVITRLFLIDAAEPFCAHCGQKVEV